MELTIQTPEESTTVTVVWIDLTTDEGNFIVQSDYIDTVFALSQNKEFTYCLATGKQHSFPLTQPAILEIKDKKGLLLLQQTKR